MIRDINWAISAWKAKVSVSSSMAISWATVGVSSGICGEESQDVRAGGDGGGGGPEPQWVRGRREAATSHVLA